MKPRDYDEALDQIAEENQRLILAIKQIAVAWGDGRDQLLAQAVRDAVALVDELQKEKS